MRSDKRRADGMLRRRLRLQQLEQRCMLATFTVENFNDSGPGSLRDAVEVANMTAGRDTVAFRDGLSGVVELTSGAIALLDGTKITGPGANRLTIDAHGSSQIFAAGAQDDSTNYEISGLTLTRGRALESPAGSGLFDGRGGAIVYFGSGYIAVDNVVIRGNQADFDGGGIEAGAGSVIIANSLLEQNTAGGRGGAVSGKSVIIVRSIIQGNTARSGGGAAVTEVISVVDSALAANSAEEGGALYAWDGVFDDRFFGRVNVFVSNSTISGNAASNRAAGLFIAAGTTAIHNSTITANRSSGQAGGVFVYEVLGEITNSIVAGNSAGGGVPDLRISSSELDVAFSLIGDSDGSGLDEAQTADASGNLIGRSKKRGGQGIIVPRLGKLEFNGGATPTHALQPGSLAIDAGSSMPGGNNVIPPADQRGRDFSRVVDSLGHGARIDMGAFELGRSDRYAAADFNQDGKVDAADYTVWRDNLGEGSGPTTPRYSYATGNPSAADYTLWRDNLGARSSIRSPLTGDFNDDGTVNESDYSIWKTALRQNSVDADFDGAADAEDHAVWKDAFRAESSNSPQAFRLGTRFVDLRFPEPEIATGSIVVEMAEGAGPFAEIAQLAEGERSLYVDNLQPDSQYTFRQRFVEGTVVSFTDALQITTENTAPMAFQVAARTGLSQSVLLSPFPFDVDNQSVSVTVLDAMVGTVTLEDTPEGKVWRYTPSPGFVGYESFRYRVEDSGGRQSDGTATVRVSGAAEERFKNVQGENVSILANNAYVGRLFATSPLLTATYSTVDADKRFFLGANAENGLVALWGWKVRSDGYIFYQTGAREYFEVIGVDDDATFALRASNGKYLRLMDDGRLAAVSDSVGSREHLRFNIVPPNVSNLLLSPGSDYFTVSVAFNELGADGAVIEISPAGQNLWEERARGPAAFIGGLSNGSTYDVRAKAYELVGPPVHYYYSEYSPVFSVLVGTPAPTNLQVSNEQETSFRVSWTDNSPNEDGFEIWVARGGGAFQLSKQVSSNATTAVIDRESVNGPQLSPNTSYTVKILAYRDFGPESEFSLAVPAHTTYDPVGVPTNLDVTNEQETSFQLSWTDNSNNEDGFEIWVARGGGPFQLSERVSRDGTTTLVEYEYRDGPQLTPNTDYRVKVRAYRDNGAVSEFSIDVPARTKNDQPGAPTNPDVSQVGERSFQFSWTDNSSNEDGFEIWVARGGGAFQLSERVDRNGTTALVEFEYQNGPQLTPNTDYRVKVRAYRDSGPESQFSIEQSLRTLDNRPAAPTNLRVENVQRQSFLLKWRDNATNETKFVVQVKRDNATDDWDHSEDVPMNADGGLTSTTVEYEQSGNPGIRLARNTKYLVRVRAVASDGTLSEWSEVLAVMTAA